MKTITPEMVYAYVTRGGTECPCCGTWDVEGGSIEIMEGAAYQPMTCNKCDAGWTDGYTLDRVLPENSPCGDFIYADSVHDVSPA